MQWFLDLHLTDQILILYLVGVNLLAFFYFGWDKFQSTLGKQRISEKMLWFLALIGGSIGSLVAMRYFRHKTRKISFQAILALILAIQIWLVVFIISN